MKSNTPIETAAQKVARLKLKLQEQTVLLNQATAKLAADRLKLRSIS